MSPKGASAPELELQAFLPYRISILANTLSRALATRYAEEFDLSVPQWRVMAVLGRESGLSPGEVVERTAMDKVGVSRAVAGLVEAGRVSQSTDPTDGRRRRLRLTASGRRVYRRIVPRALDFERRFMEGLDSRDRTMLNELLPVLQAAADRVANDEAGTLPATKRGGLRGV